MLLTLFSTRLEPQRRLNDDAGNRNRKYHLDVGQSVSVCPIAAQSLHVLPSRQSQVVVATAGDVRCHSKESKVHMRISKGTKPAGLMTSLLVQSQSESSRMWDVKDTNTDFTLQKKASCPQQCCNNNIIIYILLLLLVSTQGRCVGTVSEMCPHERQA